MLLILSQKKTAMSLSLAVIFPEICGINIGKTFFCNFIYPDTKIESQFKPRSVVPAGKEGETIRAESVRFIICDSKTDA